MAKSRRAIALDESTLSLHLKAGLTARSLYQKIEPEIFWVISEAVFRTIGGVTGGLICQKYLGTYFCFLRSLSKF